MGAVLGGALIGVVLLALGGLLLNGAYIGGMWAGEDLVAGVAFFTVGAAFFLVSVILLPGLRAIRMESSTRAP